MHLMTYISPRVAIWGPFCVPPVYTVYNNSRSRKELLSRACVPVVYQWPSSSLRGSSHPFRLLFLFHHFLTPAVVIRLSRSITRGFLRTLRRGFASPSRAGLPSWTFLASCATVNHSACDCVQLITVIRLFLVPVYRTLIIIIDFSRTSLPYFHAVSYARPRGCTAKRISVAPCRTTDHGKACHSVAYTRDLSVCCTGSEIRCETTHIKTARPR